MKGIGRILEKKYGELCFGLLAGLSYFIIILQFILDNTAKVGGLLGLFLAPLLICFPAIVLIKFTRELREKERFDAVNALILAHLILLIIALVSAVAMIV